MKIFNKKAISPLIATVLVIGFTIVLAGVVYTFILPLTTSATEKAKSDVALQNLCSSLSTNLAVKDATVDGTALKVVIDNPSAVAVQKLTVKYFDDAGNGASAPIAGSDGPADAEIGPGGLKTETVTINAVAVSGTVNKVEVTPFVYLEASKETSPCGTAVVSATVY